MTAILVDASVWINLLRKNPTASVEYFKREIETITIATCPTIVQEVLQGIASDSDYATMKNYFMNLIQLPGNPYMLAQEASQLYRQIRKKGITIRKPNDCLIAAYAIANDIELLHDDKDFVFISQHSNLKVVDL